MSKKPKQHQLAPRAAMKTKTQQFRDCHCSGCQNAGRPPKLKPWPRGISKECITEMEAGIDRYMKWWEAGMRRTLDKALGAPKSPKKPGRARSGSRASHVR